MVAGEGDEAAVARLLAVGADPGASASGQLPSGEEVDTALCAAAANGQLEVARLLFDGGADPSRATSSGGTPNASVAGQTPDGKVVHCAVYGGGARPAGGGAAADGGRR
jgi:ankyrin repeat protein